MAMKRRYLCRLALWLLLAMGLGWIACTPQEQPPDGTKTESSATESTVDRSELASKETPIDANDAGLQESLRETVSEQTPDSTSRETRPEATATPDFPPLSKDDPATASRSQARPYLTPAPHAIGMKDLESLLEPIRRKHQLPSLIAAVYQKDRIVAMGAVGARKAFAAPHIQLKDKFHLGSCTKAMTATLAAWFVEQGKLTWDTTLAMVFVQWKDQIHPDLQGVTLAQLLSNRAGLSTNIPMTHPLLWNSLWNTKMSPREARLDFAKVLLKGKPQLPPNTRFAYSNAGFMIAGVMLEEFTGKAWETLMQEHIFTPLGMASCGFGAPATAGQIDQPWGHQVQGTTYKPITPGPMSDNPPALGPAGTVHCSLPDWSKFIALHLKGAQGKSGLLLTPESFKELHKPRSTGTPYAMGWIVLQRTWAKGLALFHNGTNTLYFASVWLAPNAEKFFITATNQGGEKAVKGTDDTHAGLLQHGY